MGKNIDGFGNCFLTTAIPNSRGKYVFWVIDTPPNGDDENDKSTRRFKEDFVPHGIFYGGNLYFDDDETFALLTLMMS